VLKTICPTNIVVLREAVVVIAKALKKIPICISNLKIGTTIYGTGFVFFSVLSETYFTVMLL
jgi:hypothetical protein